jgi:hypothetical protein
LIPIALTVAIFLDHYRVPIPMFVAISDDCAVVISIAVAVMTSANCYANAILVGLRQQGAEEVTKTYSTVAFAFLQVRDVDKRVGHSCLVHRECDTHEPVF